MILFSTDHHNFLNISTGACFVKKPLRSMNRDQAVQTRRGTGVGSMQEGGRGRGESQHTQSLFTVTVIVVIFCSRPKERK